MNMSTFVPIWDYYSATMPEESKSDGSDVLVHLADGPIRLVPPVVPGYHRALEIPHDGMKMWVNQAPGKPDHIKASGEVTETVVRALRERAPGHSVSRADAAWNFEGGRESYAQAVALIRMNLPGNMHWQELTDHKAGIDSQTFYVGSRKGSEAFGRLYEHSLAHEGVVDKNRWEVEIKPGKAERKRYLATVSPLEAMCWAKWSREVSANLFGTMAAAAPPRLARVTDRDRALDQLASQWGRRLWELVEFHGGDVDSAMLDLLARVPESQSPSVACK